MERHRFRHLKRNVIAGLVLCLVLAGTAYASVKVTQHATAGITCSGHCPAARVYWAYVDSTGVPGSLSPGPTVQQTALGGVPAQITHVGTGSWIVYFSGDDLSNCAKFGNLTDTPGSVTVGEYSSQNPDAAGIPVWTYNPQGNLTDADFVIGVLCGGGLGSRSEISNGIG